MIPKTIHYCWFGGNPLPEKFHNYIEGWQRIMPDFAIKRWDENNSPMDLLYMQNALQHKKWANLSNYTRLHALCYEGGIYLDTDIEVLKTFESILNYNAFLGFEDIHIKWDGCVNNAVFGSIPKHPFVEQMMNKLLVEFDGTEKAHLSSPNLTTRLLKENGMKNYVEQDIASVHLFPIEYFYPYSWHQEFTPECIKPETLCIHRFDRSWDSSVLQNTNRGLWFQFTYNLRKLFRK